MTPGLAGSNPVVRPFPTFSLVGCSSLFSFCRQNDGKVKVNNKTDETQEKAVYTSYLSKVKHRDVVQTVSSKSTSQNKNVLILRKIICKRNL